MQTTAYSKLVCHGYQ